MQRLRGTFSATPIEHDHSLRPFLDPKLIRKKARLRRLVANGITPTKAELDAMCADAIKSHRITICPTRKRTISRNSD